MIIALTTWAFAAEYNACSAGKPAYYGTADACECVGMSQSDWYSDLFSNHMKASGTCYEWSSLLPASSRTQKQLVAVGEGALEKFTGSTYWWDRPSDSVVWEDLGDDQRIPPVFRGGIIELDPFGDWIVRNGLGEVLATVEAGGMQQGSHVMFGDWDDDGFIDMTVAWQDGQIWDVMNFQIGMQVLPPIQ